MRAACGSQCAINDGNISTAVGNVDGIRHLYEAGVCGGCWLAGNSQFAVRDSVSCACVVEWQASKQACW